MLETTDNSEFADLRTKAGLSISQTAELIGRSPRTIRRYEARGDSGTNPPSLAIAELKKAVEYRSARLQSSERAFRFVDAFAGIGGLRIPFEEIGGRCVFTAEWDRFSCQTYASNYSNGDDHEFGIDIRPYAEAPERVPEHDVLLAGFPCQPFSIAGVSKKNSMGRVHGFECKTQGTLFFDVARIIKEKQPKAFLLENVKNLMSHDKGRTFQVIKETLQDELGYRIFPKVIDAKGFVPQHRERIYIVGFREDTDFSWDAFGYKKQDEKTMKDILHPQDGSENTEIETLKNFIVGKKGKVDDKYILSDKLWNYLYDYAAKHKAKGNGFGYGMVTKNSTSRTLSARYYKDGSEILVSRGKGNPRRLTPRECARLMGYPENFKIPVSDTQAYKQFGNSVAMPVIKEIARIMKPHIMTLIEEEEHQAHQYALLA